MKLKKILSGVIIFISLVASTMTIVDFVGERTYRRPQKQDTEGVIERTVTNDNKERTLVGKLWHDAFSEERIPVKERREVERARFDEVDGVFNRLAFILFYYPIGGIIVILLAFAVTPLAAFYILDPQDFHWNMEGIVALVMGFVMSLWLLLGFYLIIITFII